MTDGEMTRKLVHVINHKFPGEPLFTTAEILKEYRK